MEGKGPLKQDAAYKALEAHYATSGKDVDIAKAFAADPKRFDKFRCGLRVAEREEERVDHVILAYPCQRSTTGGRTSHYFWSLL